MKPHAISKTFLLIYFTACTTAKIASPSLAALQTKEVIKVSLHNLLKNKATYQGYYIETEGVYKRSFEESAIYYPITLPLGDTVIKGELITGIGDVIARRKLACGMGFGLIAIQSIKCQLRN